MNVGLNAFFIDNPTIGMGQHTFHLAAELRVQMQATETLTMLLPQPHRVQRSGRTDRLQAALTKLWWEQVGIVRAASREHVDLLHTPYWTNPLAARGPTVVTVHDVIQLVLPGYRRTPASRLYFALASAGARRAAAVLTVSRSAASDITRLLGVPASQVHVVGNGVHPDMRPVEARAQLASVRARYGLPQSYVLYLGCFEPRKNIARLVEAYALLPEAVQVRCALVLAGNSQRELPGLEALASRLGVQHRLVMPGVIAEEDKPAVLSAAQAFAFPSLYEGFGLPPLEAMACGIPVLVSNVSSLPEIVGDAAVLVSPTNVPGIASGLEQLISNDQLRDDLKERGLERAGQYAWPEVARRVLAVYRQIRGGAAV